MKIGIITFQKSKNYGGVLQAYALYTRLKQLGYSVEMVDYWPTYRDSMQFKFPKNFWKLSIIRKTKAVIRYILTIRSLNVRHKRFENFALKHFNLKASPMYKNGSLIEEHFDVCIYGSDQIWRNYQLDDFKGIDETYFGVYPKNCSLKITYAASMGEINHDNNTVQKIGELLSNFNNISVRESSLKLFLKTNYEIDSTLVCDPTFLLSKKDWMDIIPSTQRKIKKKYILFYHLMPSKLGQEIAQNIAKKFNCDLIEIPQKPLKTILGVKIARTAGPIEFLELIRDAEFVVTTSFHGIAFSIIFEKQFYALGMGQKSDRALTALKTLKLTDRYIYNTKINLTKNIDFINVNKKLDFYKKNSLSFLLDNITKQ